MIEISKTYSHDFAEKFTGDFAQTFNAAQSGDVDAQKNLGLLYLAYSHYQGIHVKQDSATALVFFQQLAKNNPLDIYASNVWVNKLTKELELENE